MAGGISLNFDDVLGRKKKQKREAEAAQIAQSLLERGGEPDAVNEIASHYLKTGEFKAPEFQTKNLPPTNMFPEGIPTRQPFNLGVNKKKGLFTMDQQTGQMTQVPTPDDMTDYEVKGYKDTTNDNVGHSWKIDRATGQRQDMGPNGRTFDSYVYWNSKEGQPRGSGGSGKGGAASPDVELAKDTVKKYQAAKQKGLPMAPDFITSAKSAFDMLGIPMTQEEQDPTFGDKIRNAASTMTKGMVTPAPQRLGEPVPKFDQSTDAAYARDLAAARQAVAKGLVKPEDALKRLQGKYGKRVNGL